MTLVSQVPMPPAPEDKIQVTKNPPALPHSCVICNSMSNGVRNYIDFNASLDWYGAIYICEDCIIPVSHAIGFVEVIKLVEAEAEAQELRQQLQERDDELIYYRSLVDSLKRLRPDLTDSSQQHVENAESDNPRPEEPTEVERRPDPFSI